MADRDGTSRTGGTPGDNAPAQETPAKGTRTGERRVRRRQRGGWIRRMLPFVLRQRGSLVRTFVAGLVWSGVSAAVPPVERHVVDDVILASRSSLTPWLLLLFALGVT